MILRTARSIAIGALLMVAACAITPQAAAQSSLAEFDIVVEPTDDGFALTCNAGCVWETLSWTGHDEVRVNYFGMTEAEEADRFLFALSSIDGGFKLEGIEGTAWASLNWECENRETCKARVDASGLSPVR